MLRKNEITNRSPVSVTGVTVLSSARLGGCAGNGGAPLSSERDDHFEKRNAVEIGVAGADPGEPMLAHQDRVVRVMDRLWRRTRLAR